MGKGIPIILLLALLIVIPASAEYSLAYNDRGSIIAETPQEGYVIPQVNINDLETPSNTSIILNSYGSTWLIWFNTSESLGGAFVRAEASIYDPSGNTTTVINDHVEIPLLGARKVDLTIQQRYIQGRSVLNLIYHLYPGVPTGHFENIYFLYVPENINYDDFIPFTGIQVESNTTFDALVYYCTRDEFTEIKETSIAGGLWNTATGVTVAMGSVAWDTAISAIELIPVIGPAFALVLEWLETILEWVLWGFRFFFVDNWLGTLVCAEFIIIAEAIVKTKNYGPVDTMRRVASNQIWFFTAIIVIFTWLASIVWNIIITVASFLQGIKPV